MLQIQEHLQDRLGEIDGAAVISKRKVRVCIVTGMFHGGEELTGENFLPKIDGVTRTLARLLDHLRETGHEALVVGPDNGLVHPDPVVLEFSVLVVPPLCRVRVLITDILRGILG